MSSVHVGTRNSRQKGEDQEEGPLGSGRRKSFQGGRWRLGDPPRNSPSHWGDAGSWAGRAGGAHDKQKLITCPALLSPRLLTTAMLVTNR